MEIWPAFCLPACALMLVTAASAAAQNVPRILMPQAPLKLTAEVATTTDEGYPSSLRVTLTNTGGMSISMPLPIAGCAPDNGLRVNIGWFAPGQDHGFGSGGGCGVGEPRSLQQRVRHSWIKVRSGESVVTTINLLAIYPSTESGAIHYSVEFDPPDAKPNELNDLWRSGYLIPTARLRTEDKSFQIQ